MNATVKIKPARRVKFAISKKMLKMVNSPGYVITEECRRMLDFPALVNSLTDEQCKAIVDGVNARLDEADRTRSWRWQRVRA